MSPNKWMWLVAGAALAACGAEKGNMSVSVKSAAVAPAAGTAGADLGSGITLTEVRMVVRRIDLATAMPPPATAPSPADMEHQGGNDDADDLDVSFGPFPVDVKGNDLAGGIHPAFDAQVKAGTYLGARVVVNTLPDQFPADPVLAAMQALHASIVADGTIDGAAFEFATPMRVAQFKAGPITVGDSSKPTKNLTLDVDPRGWFKGENGTRLDPRLETDRGEILENIRCSIRLFEDDDLDGKPDDGDPGEAPGCPPSAPPVTPPAMPPAAAPMTP